VHGQQQIRKVTINVIYSKQKTKNNNNSNNKLVLVLQPNVSLLFQNK